MTRYKVLSYHYNYTTMLKQTIAVSGILVGLGVAGNVWHGRYTARNNIKRISQAKSIVPGWDEAIKAHELSKQEEWLKRPFYRQLMMPPKPYKI